MLITPGFVKGGKRTSNLAFFAKIMVLDEGYIQAEDGLTGKGKMNLKNLLTLDDYPSTATVRRLAKCTSSWLRTALVRTSAWNGSREPSIATHTFQQRCR